MHFVYNWIFHSFQFVNTDSSASIVHKCACAKKTNHVITSQENVNALLEQKEKDAN